MAVAAIGEWYSPVASTERFRVGEVGPTPTLTRSRRSQDARVLDEPECLAGTVRSIQSPRSATGAGIADGRAGSADGPSSIRPMPGPDRKEGPMSATLSRPASRIARGVAATAFAALLLAAPPAAVHAGEPPTTTDPALAAGGWLATQVETDATLGVGTLADAIFAFAALGVGGEAAATAYAGIEANVEAYVAPGGVVAPGALAKVLLAVQVMGGDPTAFGPMDRDLEADLRALIVSGGADDGQIEGAGPVEQALGVLALSRTAGGAPAATVAWLAAQQCPSGEYSWDATCPASGAEDPDTTALALQALLAGGSTSAADAAATWLVSLQQPGGGLPSYGTANTNSSGVGGQALRAAGETAAADAAATFVLSLAIGCEGDPADRGAIGWAEGTPGFLVFSTPQAVLALGAPPLDELTAAGIAPEAPVLQCATGAVPSPTPAPAAPSSPAAGGGGARPAPSGGALPDTSLDGSGDAAATVGTLAVLVAGAAACGAGRMRRAIG